MPLLDVPPELQALLTDLHTRSLKQENAIPADLRKSIRAKLASDVEAGKTAMDEVMLDKFIALDEDKAHFMYNLLLSLNATTILEAGTSFGVSTIYLALAASKSAATSEKPGAKQKGLVIATEKEESKAAIARENWKAAGHSVEGVIDLRVGDLEETLQDLRLDGDRLIDAVLLDIWPYVALPALNLAIPKLRRGAVVLTDNTVASAEGYKELFAVLRNPEGPFQSVTLPYAGGLEMSVYLPRSAV